MRKTENGVVTIWMRGEGVVDDTRLRLRSDWRILLHTDTKTKFFFFGRLHSSWWKECLRPRRAGFTRIFRRARDHHSTRDISTLHYTLLLGHHCERAKTKEGQGLRARGTGHLLCHPQTISILCMRTDTFSVQLRVLSQRRADTETISWPA